ncbi:hypothetical protein L211DRAFT_884452 [Terfezia boudieri ATCC MYA-4762]|uniref:Uncharacterized protein n=1 Tax=Terfezia boudieri ATCC MYA-4762 TaxID=1051890 RepID=A0A3N4LPT0_9PEZI|nr:hypothetical protein L211DRAFT_884452 [Terfezia boudieri ATCC MYA-4762]
MLRLLRQPGICVTTRPIALQHIQHREYRFINGSANELSSKHKTDNDHLRDRIVWDIVNKLDDRVHSLSKDVGDLKGDFYKSISELATSMGRGFGEIRAERHENRAENREDIGPVTANNNSGFEELQTETNCKIEGIKNDLKGTKWQVRLLFGAVIFCLFKDYVEARFSRVNMVPGVIADQNANPRK